MRISFTAACCVLRPASFSLEISMIFWTGKPVAALRSLELAEGFLWGSATNAASWPGLDTRHNPVPLRLPTCPSLWYFCSHNSWHRTVHLQCWHLTFRLLMSYIYIYGAPSKARNANVIYIWTYIWQRWNSLFLFAAQCFNTESMQRGFLCHICV